MFSNISNGTAAGPSAPQSAKKATIIEEIYKKEFHPNIYIGSTEELTEEMWIYDREKELMVKKEITYVPGLYQIFDEILVNAADNKQRDKRMDCIKIEIKPDKNLISVWNNGQGIPVQMHKKEKMYVPTMMFGHLFTSSNYNDDEEKLTVGRNGYGAKLCNIFSEKFIVETASKQTRKRFKQTWAANMTKMSAPKIQKFTGDDFTKVTFSPDLAKFKMQRLDDDIVALMTRRAYDVAASMRGVKVVLNGSMLPIRAFGDYVNLCIKDKKDNRGKDLKIVYEQAGERWEVAITLSDGTFNQMSFVNNIATTKGGRHVDYVVDMIIKYLIELFRRKYKNSTVEPAEIKNRIWVFINCSINNPIFDSHTKENMTSPVKNFGSKCTLSETFYKSVTQIGIVEAMVASTFYSVLLSLSDFRFDNVMDIFRKFYPLRLKMYQKRKDYLEGMLESEAKILSNQARFIMEESNGKLTMENKKHKVIIEELQNKGYDIDPVLEWKDRVSDGIDDAEATQDEEEEEQATDHEYEGSSRKKTGDKNVKSLTESNKFDYLLGMSMWMLTEEKKNELLKQRDDKLNELKIFRKKSNFDLWREDLDAFCIKLYEVEEKECKAEAETEIGRTAKLEFKKNLKPAEMLPSPIATRVIPKITDEDSKMDDSDEEFDDFWKNSEDNAKLISCDSDDVFDWPEEPEKMEENSAKKKKRKMYSYDSDDDRKMTNNEKTASTNKKKKTVSESDDDELPMKKPPARAQYWAEAAEEYVHCFDSE